MTTDMTNIPKHDRMRVSILRQARLEAGLTPEKLAKRLKVPREEVIQTEAYQLPTSLEKAELYIRALRFYNPRHFYYITRVRYPHANEYFIEQTVKADFYHDYTDRPLHEVERENYWT